MLVLASDPASAQESKGEALRKFPRYPLVCDDDAPSRCTQPLLAGEQAPFDGQLLNPPKAIALGQAAAHCDDRIALEVSRTSSISGIELAHARELARIDATALARERDLYRDLYEAKPVGVPWYEEPAFIVPATVLATLGVILLATRVVEIGGK